MVGKSELIQRLVDSGDFKTLKDAKKAFKAIFSVVKESIAEKGQVNISGFGSFTMALRKERQGRNPRTGHPVVIPSHQVVKFRPGKLLRQRINS